MNISLLFLIISIVFNMLGVTIYVIKRHSSLEKNKISNANVTQKISLDDILISSNKIEETALYVLDKQELFNTSDSDEDIALRLTSLGFKNSSTVKKFYRDVDEFENSVNLKIFNKNITPKNAKEILYDLDYFKKKYPNYIVVFENSLKYFLEKDFKIIDVESFKGDASEFLSILEDTKILEDDIRYLYRYPEQTETSFVNISFSQISKNNWSVPDGIKKYYDAIKGLITLLESDPFTFFNFGQTPHANDYFSYISQKVTILKEYIKLEIHPSMDYRHSYSIEPFGLQNIVPELTPFVSVASFIKYQLEDLKNKLPKPEKLSYFVLTDGEDLNYLMHPAYRNNKKYYLILQ